MSPLILFVCTGNICRSPMAAALLAAFAEKQAHEAQFLVESAGTWGVDGQPASSNSQLVMTRQGLTLEGHRARTITPELADAATLIIVMTRDHKYALSAEFPAARPKIHLMSELVNLEYDITDPYGGPLEGYELCANDLAALIERGYPRLQEWLGVRTSETGNVT